MIVEVDKHWFFRSFFEREVNMRIKALEIGYDFDFVTKQNGIKTIFDNYNIKSIPVDTENHLWEYEIDEEKFDLKGFKKDFKSNFGIKYNREIAELERRFNEEKEKQNMHTIIKSFAKLSDTILKNISISSQHYVVCGDVTNCQIKDKNSYLDLVFDNNSFHKMKVYIESNKFISDEDKKVLENMDESSDNQKEIQVTGTIEYDVKNMQFQIIPTKKIEIIGQSKRLQQISLWKEEIKNHSLEKQKTYYYLPKRIGLITNQNSKGYRDFKEILGKNYYDEYIGTRFKDVPLKADNIIKAIKEFNADNDCDCIFIVSGGGNPYWLLEFSNIELLEEISNSKIPIFTGIGHSDDELLCDKVSSQCFPTPSKAADHIKMLINKGNKDEKERIYAKNKKEKNNEIEHLKIEIQEKDNEIAKLKRDIQEKDSEIAKLKGDIQENTRKKSKGFLGRIFGD